MVVVLFFIHLFCIAGPSEVVNGSVVPTVINATLRFQPGEGFVDRYDISISPGSDTLQSVSLIPGDIGSDGHFTVLFNDSRMIPGMRYTVVVASISGNLRTTQSFETTLGKVLFRFCVSDDLQNIAKVF